MSNTFVAGRPGGHATRLARGFQFRALIAVVVAAASGWFALERLDDLTAGGSPAVLAGASCAVALAAVLAARAFQSRAARAAVGARSERRVAATAQRLAPVGLLHSVDLAAGGDADHLLCGPKLVVVETKTGSGVVSYVDGKLCVNNRPMRGNPVAQCRRQALAAKQRFGVFCDAVVCVVDMVNAPFTVASVHICSAADLPAVYTGFPDRLQPDQAWARAVELAPSCSTRHDRSGVDGLRAGSVAAPPSRSGSSPRPLRPPVKTSPKRPAPSRVPAPDARSTGPTKFKVRSTKQPPRP